MSLDQYHWMTAVGQFSGQLKRLPGKKDDYYTFRRNDGMMYMNKDGCHARALKKSICLISGYQSLLKSEDDKILSLSSDMVGTTHCYELMMAALSIFGDNINAHETWDLASLYTEIVSCTQTIIEGTVPPVITSGVRKGLMSSDGAAILFKSASEELLKCYDAATSDHQARRNAWKNNPDESLSFGSFKRMEKGIFNVYSMGSLVIVRVGSTERLLTPEHFKKLSRFMITFRNLSLLMADMTLRSDGSNLEVMRLICRLGIRDQSHVGAGFRVLRSYVMALGVDSESALSNPITDVKNSFEGTKLEFGLEIIDVVLGLTDSYSELTQLGGLYKYVISPDISMYDCFRSAYGMKEPNHPLPSAKRRFRGLLRKRIFLNLMKSKQPVHATSPDEGLDTELNRPTPSAVKLEKVPLEKWSEVVFSKLKDAEVYKDIDLRTNDKSSANDIASEPGREICDYNLSWLKGESSAPLLPMSLSKSNDVLSHLSTGYKPGPRDGFRRFKSLVSAHTSLELRLMSKHGIRSRYDIPSSLLSDAILKDESLFYTVNTEPKEGEFHKPAGRLFYMATRDMKAYISSVERLCRTLFHGQVGNSIVSSFSRREEQLRTMARSTSHKSNTVQPYFVSFDMSEFSKKFPMELVNEIGEVFSELTGDEELCRLDVIFRAGVVCHSTRSFEGLFAGVKGGFEGFLNFVWTAAHVTIMEIALLNTQKQGLVMAYSDDGLLEFIVPKELDKDGRRDIVSNIQKTYSNLGLSFHLFKTLVATNIFEYLGLVAIDGRYVDTWGKSLSNLGIREQRSAFTPFSDIIDTYVGQGRSAVDALCPVDLVYYHMILDIVLLIQRRSSKLSVKQILAIVFLPRSLGGFGVPGQLDMCITTERPSIEGFIHTATMMSSNGNPYIEQAIYTALDSPPEIKEQMKALLQGSYITTSIPKLGGNSICQRLAEKVAEKAGFKEISDPMTVRLMYDLTSVARTFKNFPLPLFVKLIDSSPKFQEFSSRLEIASSRGAFTYLGRSEIRHAQSTDSRNVVSVLKFWERIFSQSFSPDDGILRPSVRLYGKVNRQLVDNGFAPIRLRPESMLMVSKSSEESVMFSEVNLDMCDLIGNPRRNKKLDDSVYASPNMSSGAPDNTPIFDTTEGVSKSLPDKMLKMIGRLIAICPEGLDNIYAMVTMLGASLPSIPSGVKGDLSRLRALIKGKPSVVVKVSQTLYALSTVEYMKKFTSAAILGQVTDYTTPIMFGRAATALCSYRYGDLTLSSPSGRRKMWFTLKEGFEVSDLAYEVNVSVVSRVSDDLFRKPVTDDTHWSSRAMHNLISEMKSRVSVIGTEKESAEMRQHLSYALSQRSARRISLKMKKLPHSVIIDERLLTDDDNMNSEISRLAYLEVARIMIESKHTDKRSLSVRRDVFLEQVSSLSEELPSFMSQASFHAMLFNGEYKSYVQQAEIASLVSLGRRKSTLTEPLMSPQSYRELISHSLKDMYRELHDKSSQIKWNGSLEIGHNGTSALVPSARSSFSVDMILDGLTAMLESIRSSNHRTRPYNQTTFLINYAKLVALGGEYYSCRVDEKREDTIREFSSTCLSERSSRELKEAIAKDLGPDHSRLIGSPLGDICSKRVSIYSRLKKSKLPITLPKIYNYGWAEVVLQDGRALQHFLNGAVCHYLTHNVAQIPTQILRSSEASHVLSGMWQMRQLYMTSIGNIGRSEVLPGRSITDCLAAQMRLLMRKTSLSDASMSLQVDIGDMSRELIRAVTGLSRLSVNVYDPLDVSDFPAEINYKSYPGESNHQPGEYYYFYYGDLPAKNLVATYARLSTFGELVADLARDGGKYVLVGCIFVTEEATEDIMFSTDVQDGDTSYSSMSSVGNDDAKLLLGTPLVIATGRRMCEAGIILVASDPLDVNPSLLLAKSTGVGLSRQGSWEGRVLSGEDGLVAATIRSHSVATPKDVVIGAAIAWASLKLRVNATADEVHKKSLEIISSWQSAIRFSPKPQRVYVKMGITSEIAEISTWLRGQNFQLPVTEEVSELLIRDESISIDLLEGAAARVVVTEFTLMRLDVGYIRNLAQKSDSFSEVSETAIAERGIDRQSLDEEADNERDVSSMGSSDRSDNLDDDYDLDRYSGTDWGGDFYQEF